MILQQVPFKVYLFKYKQVKFGLEDQTLLMVITKTKRRQERILIVKDGSTLEILEDGTRMGIFKQILLE